MKKYKNLFFSLFKIGIIGFGGGSALIPVIEKTVVEDKKLINKEDYDVDVMVASITPGALPVEISAGIGKRLAGSTGLLLGAIVMAIPGVILTLFLLSLLAYVNDVILQQIGFLTLGIYAYIFSLIIEYIKGTLCDCSNDKFDKKRIGTFALIVVVVLLVSGKNLYRLLKIEGDPRLSLSTLSVFVIAFFVILFTRGKLSLKKIIIAAACCIVYIFYKAKSQFITNKYIFGAICAIMLGLSIYGIIKDYRETGKKCINSGSIRGALKDTLICFIFLLVLTLPAFAVTKDSLIFVGKGFLSSILSFGGGDAYLTVADGMFVSTEMITESEFYSNLVPIVNVIPGSILCKTLSGVGYYIGLNSTNNIFSAILVAMAGFGASIAASCSVFTIVAAIYDQFGSLPIFGIIRKSIRPIVSGLLLNVILSSLVQATKQETVFGSYIFPIIVIAVIFGINRVLLKRFHVKSELLVVISIAGSLMICNVFNAFVSC